MRTVRGACIAFRAWTVAGLRASPAKDREGSIMDKQIQTTELGTSSVEVVKTPRYAWVILAITYFASITAPLGQFKVTAIAGEIDRCLRPELRFVWHADDLPRHHRRDPRIPGGVYLPQDWPQDDVHPRDELHHRRRSGRGSHRIDRSFSTWDVSSRASDWAS